jgi:hypothetical protein
MSRLAWLRRHDSAAISLSQFRPIMQHDSSMPRFRQTEDAFLLKTREHPTDGFKRHPEIIRNRLTFHWKDHYLGLLQAAVYFQQKGGNFLQRCLAA